ncbi:MAG: sulfatase/phosphatase domain-containing protein [Verrucomicrobiales bacterium]
MDTLALPSALGVAFRRMRFVALCVILFVLSGGYRGQSLAAPPFDIAPTFLELAGAKPSDPDAQDAVSLVPVLEGQRMPEGRELYFVRREGGPRYGGKSYEAIIRGEWKLMQNDPFSPLELYNLRDDPHESSNLAALAPQLFNDLSKALARHIQRGGASPWQK